MHSFSLVYLDAAELLEEHQGGWLGQRGDLCQGQEEAEGLFVRGKGCGTKHLSCTFLNSRSYLALVELQVDFLLWYSKQLHLQIKKCSVCHFSASTVTRSERQSTLHSSHFCLLRVQAVCLSILRASSSQSLSWKHQFFPQKCRRTSPMPLWGFTWPGFYKVALNFAGRGRCLPQCDYF